jgi:hypothetical protein
MKEEKQYKKEATNRAERVQAKKQKELGEKSLLTADYQTANEITDIERDIIQSLLSSKKATGGYLLAFVDAMRLIYFLNGQVRSSFISAAISEKRKVKKECINYFLRVLKKERIVNSVTTTEMKGRIFYLSMDMGKMDFLEKEIKARKKRIDDDSDVDTIQC